MSRDISGDEELIDLAESRMTDQLLALGSVVVQINVVGLCHDFAVIIVTTCATNVMRALQLATVWAFIWIASNQCVM
ncbi:hypothetical protein GCM10007939_10820 [Amylibacter marinus]|uniref:Uncharacterized protein n=1 Tax=Amylibacter marinus TaxID=1475483 RepID=A0ABQ5VUG3_9RHOB|nr:hypothetical protein GCM10007939_10820 [Amylibacter marinus]